MTSVASNTAITISAIGDSCASALVVDEAICVEKSAGSWNMFVWLREKCEGAYRREFAGNRRAILRAT